MRKWGCQIKGGFHSWSRKLWEPCVRIWEVKSSPTLSFPYNSTRLIDGISCIGYYPTNLTCSKAFWGHNVENVAVVTCSICCVDVGEKELKYWSCKSKENWERISGTFCTTSFQMQNGIFTELKILTPPSHYTRVHTSKLLWSWYTNLKSLWNTYLWAFMWRVAWKRQKVRQYWSRSHEMDHKCKSLN